MLSSKFSVGHLNFSSANTTFNFLPVFLGGEFVMLGVKVIENYARLNNMSIVFE